MSINGRVDHPVDTTVMVFSGEYDVAYRDQLRAAFDSVAHAPRLVLDFSDVTYIDSTIIGEMVRLHNARAVNDLERATVVLDNPNLRRTFDILMLAAVFHVVKALDDAVGKDGRTLSVQYASSFDGSTATSRNGASKGHPS